MSSISFINNYRVEKANEMLIETNLSLIEISMECGFNNLSYFIKEFKKYKSFTPNEIRKKNSIYNVYKIL